MNPCAGAPTRPSDFSLEVHHGGSFTFRPNKVYTGGKLDTIHGLEPDYMSLLELDAMVQRLGYAPNTALYHKKPNCTFDNGLVKINSDKEAYGMLDFLHTGRIAKVYLEHIGGVTFIGSQDGSSIGQSNVEVFDLDLEPIVELGSGNVETHGKSGAINLEQGFVVDIESEFVGIDDVNIVEECRNEEEENLDPDPESGSDSSTDSVYYSDHSFHENDDDRLYETFVEDQPEFNVTKGDEEVKPVYDQGPLSDGDSLYGSDNSYDSTSDEESEGRKKAPFKTFRPHTDMEDPKFKIGMFFSSTKDFKAAIKHHAIKHQRNVKLVKNDKRRVRAKCQKPCPWEVYAAKVMGESTYQVRTYMGKHTCTISYKNRNVNSTIIAKRYIEELRTNPGIPIVAFKDRVRKEMKVDVSRTQLYRAKRKAAQLNYGSDLQQYSRLWDYCEELRRSNPGSTVVMDAPIDAENCNITESNEHEWTFINDRQKGLLPAINEEVPRAEHRHCAKHLLSNFQKRFRGVSYEENFWDCSKATYVAIFEEAMARMKEEDEEAHHWLTLEPPQYWSRSHFRDIVKCDMVCNNLCEAFNKALLEATGKPIIEMLELIRCYFNHRMLIRREWIKKFGNELLPNCYSKLEENLKQSSICSSHWFGDMQYQVWFGEGEQYTVDLNIRSCSCRKWDLCGIPCPHAIAAIQEKKDKVEGYISKWYSETSYINAYQPLVKPINGSKMWPKTGFTPVIPPSERRKQGRPKKKRILGAEEYINPKYPNKLRKIGQNSVYCGRCGQHRHNRRSCTGPDVGSSRGGGRSGVQGRGGGRSGVQGSSRGGVQGSSRGGGRSGVQVRGGRTGMQFNVRGGRGGRDTSQQPRGGRSGRGGIRMRGGAATSIGSANSRGVVHMRGGATSLANAALSANQVNIPTNYDQATQASQTRGRSNAVQIRGAGNGVRMRGGGAFRGRATSIANQASQTSTVTAVTKEQRGEGERRLRRRQVVRLSIEASILLLQLSSSIYPHFRRPIFDSEVRASQWLKRCIHKKLEMALRRGE
ncbi:hypothetical protein Vadar_029198 [Vaccinium darrowii]|uniref:Uncharacterized protein n=1 Tax=Vaccinium darrowii TaxID=229202 RepID=A0ACB7XU91_9ERIC|nr:hypothetical protein Vadar_029198 [Vaccinium darrowii]